MKEGCAKQLLEFVNRKDERALNGSSVIDPSTHHILALVLLSPKDENGIRRDLFSSMTLGVIIVCVTSVAVLP